MSEYHDFNHFGLDPQILAAITEMGYTTPTPIQSKAIPIVLKGGDVMGAAQTGTGKTAGFGLPMLQRRGCGARRRPHFDAPCRTARSMSRYRKNSRTKGLRR